MASLKGVTSKAGSTISKIADHGDTLGALAGYLGTFASVRTAGDPTGYFETLIGYHVNAVKTHNIANLQNMPYWLTNSNWGTVPLMGITMAVVGAIAEQLPSMAPLQKPITRLVKKAGIGVVIGGFAAMAVAMLSSASPPNPVISGSGYSTSPRTVTTSGRVTAPLGDFQTISPRTGSLTYPMK